MKPAPDVVIVNDGSDASYDAVFEACRDKATVLKQEPNQGKGAAMRRGMRWIYQNLSPDTVVVTVDADGRLPRKIVSAVPIWLRIIRML